MKLFLLLAIILIAGCAPVPYSTTAKQNLTSAQAQATNAAIAESDAAQSSRATQQAIDDRNAAVAQQSMSATQAAISATDQAQRVSADATAQAQAAAANDLNLEQARIAATATRAALDRQMTIDTQNAQRIAAETQATITAAQVAASAVEQSSAMRSDWYYVLPDVLMRYAPCGVVLLAMFLVWYLVRGIAAKIAGDEGRARIVLANPGFTVNIPAALLPAPRDNDEIIDGETGNTMPPLFNGSGCSSFTVTTLTLCSTNHGVQRSANA